MDLDNVVLSIELTKIPLPKGNRMLRFGFGTHDGKWFVRLDLWSVGFRLNKRYGHGVAM